MMSRKPPPPPPLLVAPPSLAQLAKDLGYPDSVCEIDPSDAGYWREPGLSWGVQPEVTKEPTKCRGEYVFQMPDDTMAPRFPRGTVVLLRKVPTRASLVIGKPYVYSYADTETGELLHQVGRLEHIGESDLRARADNAPEVSLVWPVDREKGFDMVRVIDAYVTYPPEVLDKLPKSY